MITNNMSNWINGKMRGTTTPLITVDGQSGSGGSSVYPFSASSLKSNIGISKTTGTWIVFGKGTKATTPSDFTLDDIISSGYTTSTPILTASQEDASMSISVILANTSNEDLTINEVGIVYGANTSLYPSLLYREVLPSAIIVPPNGKHAFDISFNNQ